MPRPQFTLRSLLVAMLVVGAFFGGMRFGERRERDRRDQRDQEEEAETKRGIEHLLEFHKQMQADTEAVIQFIRENPWADPADGLPARRKAREADE